MTVIQPFKQGLLLRMLFSCLIDGDRINTADFDKPRAARFRQHGSMFRGRISSTGWSRSLAAFSNEGWVNQLRCKISESLPGSIGAAQGGLHPYRANGWG